MRNFNQTKQVTVLKPDGSPAIVHVRTLRIKDFPALIQAMPGDIPRQAEIYTGNKEGWAETMSDESLFEIVKAGREANGDFFAQWLVEVRAQGEQLKAPAPSTSGSQSVPSGAA